MGDAGQARSLRRRELAMSLLLSVGLIPSIAMAWRLIRKARGGSAITSRAVIWRRSLDVTSQAQKLRNRRAYSALLTGAGVLFVAPLVYSIGSLALWDPPPFARHAVGVWVGLLPSGDVLTIRINKYGTASREAPNGATCRGPLAIADDGSSLSIRPFTSILGGAEGPIACAVTHWPRSPGTAETFVVDGVEMHRLQRVVPPREGGPVAAWQRPRPGQQPAPGQAT